MAALWIQQRVRWTSTAGSLRWPNPASTQLPSPPSTSAAAKEGSGPGPMSSSTTRLASFKIIVSFNQNFESYLIVDTYVE
jgi:hypothetical protein